MKTLRCLPYNIYLHRYIKRWVFFIFFMIGCINMTTAYCQDNMPYDEVSVLLNIPKAGSTEMPSLIQGQEIYLPVKAFFDYLKIKNTLSADYDSITGFFINQNAVFLIDQAHNRIVYRDKSFELGKNELLIRGADLYLRSDYFGKIFELECLFNFRNLSVTINTKLELPVIRERRLELIRRNINKLTEERKADTIIPQKFSLFHLGAADWSITSTQQTKMKNRVRANLTAGGILLGGEIVTSLNYYSDQSFDHNQQYYRWRYVNNNHSAVRQVVAGRLIPQSISSIYAPVNGVQITNTPSTYRKSFGTYRISDKTKPGWMVELYVNDVLVNYVKADASGFFTFDVPLVYGNSAIKLRFYGPWGEERTREQTISIPFNFLPAGQFEYTASAAIVNDDKKSHFYRAEANYGLGRRITIGGGMEYLSSVMAGKPMPFLKSTMRVGSNLLLSGEYTKGVRARGIVNFRLFSNWQVDLDYAKYEPGQNAIRYNYREERTASLSMPIRGKKFNAFSRFTYTQYIFPETTKYTRLEWLLSAIIANVGTNFTSYVLYSGPNHPNVYSNLSLTFHMPGNIRFTPQVQFQYNQKKFNSIKTEAEKRVGRIGFVNISYENNIANKLSYVNLGVRLNFSFAQTSFFVQRGNKSTITTQSAMGSLLYNGKTNYFDLRNQPNVGRGGLIVVPFLDLNANGKHDRNEPRAVGLSLRIHGGRMEYTNDTAIRVTGLEAYSNYFLEFDGSGFENISWQLKKNTYSVSIEPNILKLIEVPVFIAGEASGFVFLSDTTGIRKGLGRIIVNFYNDDSVLVGKTVTGDDGYFSFLGLAPGSYNAQIDSTQLVKLHLTSSPIWFNISINKDGDIEDHLTLLLFQ